MAGRAHLTLDFAAKCFQRTGKQGSTWEMNIGKAMQTCDMCDFFLLDLW